jgi:hypothetical protein
MRYLLREDFLIGFKLFSFINTLVNIWRELSKILNYFRVIEAALWSFVTHVQTLVWGCFHLLLLLHLLVLEVYLILCLLRHILDPSLNLASGYRTPLNITLHVFIYIMLVTRVAVISITKSRYKLVALVETILISCAIVPCARMTSKSRPTFIIFIVFYIGVELLYSSIDVGTRLEFPHFREWSVNHYVI